MQIRKNRILRRLVLSSVIISAFFVSLFLTNSCGSSTFSPPEGSTGSLLHEPNIIPDYTGITIPPNIAPLNFMIEEEGEDFIALFEGSGETVLQVKAKNKVFKITDSEWEDLLDNNRGLEFRIRIYRKENDNWSEYTPIKIKIAQEPIDRYLVYRLIPPGYQTWFSMGIYQRDLKTFKETPIIKNQQINNNCVNCHSFANRNSDNMLFHIRGSQGGTIIKQGNNIQKVNINTENTISAGVYPSWHPSGKFIAFSVNNIEQYFHADPNKTIEVLDRESGLIIYNTVNDRITHVPGTKGKEYLETYPSWSPDGNYLYFCRADADENTPYDSIRYDIFKIEFDPGQNSFGNTEPVFNASEMGLSASFPRLSPDGNYLLFTIHSYGCFPVWHKEADLCLLNLSTGKAEIPGAIKSENTDSYHTWSSNGRWIVFSSRRHDGRYTKLYLSYINDEGEFQKAFLLPQKDPEFYESFFNSFNIPELIKSPVQVNPRKWSDIAANPAVQVSE
ncbi:MAG: cytochrome C biosynthesis protein [bacterium]